MNNIEKYQVQELASEMDHYDIPTDSKDSSILHLIKSVLRFWYVILGVFILIFPVSAFLVWKIFVPTYLTVGRISVEPVLINLLTGEQDKGMIASYDTYLNTEATRMKSSIVLDRVVDDLAERNLQIFGSDTNLRGALQGAIASGDIIIGPPRGQQVVEVRMESTFPREAEIVVNSFINAYMAIADDQSNQYEARQISVLEEQSRELMSSYQIKRDSLNQLAEDWGADSLQGLLNLMFNEKNRLEDKITELESRRLDLQVRKNVLTQIPDPNVLPVEMIDKRGDYINNDPYVQSTTQSLVQLKQNLQVQRQQLRPGNPELDEINELINVLQTDLEQYREAAGKEFDTNVTELLVQKNKNELAYIQEELILVDTMIAEYQSKVEQNTQQTLEMGRTEWQIQDIQTQMALDRKTNEGYHSRISELRLAAKRPARIQRMGEPVTDPPKTRRNKMLAAAAFGSFALGLCLAFLLAKADKGLYSPEEVRKCVGIPIIGTACDLTQIHRKLLPEKVAEDYKTIRANLDLLSDGKIPHKLVITSPGVKEGKSHFAVNLAKSLALAGKRILLVDGDFRRPDIGRLLNLPNGSWGVQDVLFGLKKFEDTVRSDPLTGLDVLTADGRNSKEAIELLEKPQAAECLNRIGQKYDHVIIDTPPVLAAPDARLWARMADAVVFSTFIGQTKSPELKEALKELSQIKVNILGSVLFNVSAGSHYYRYGYGYGYGYGHERGADKGKKKQTRGDNFLIASSDSH